MKRPAMHENAELEEILKAKMNFLSTSESCVNYLDHEDSRVPEQLKNVHIKIQRTKNCFAVKISCQHSEWLSRPETVDCFCLAKDAILGGWG